MEPGKVVGIISIKGGVGKTTTVANLGAALANEYKKRVLLVDANFSAPNLGLHMGIVNPQNTIHDVMQDKIPVANAIYEHEYGFHIIPASLVSTKVNPYKLRQKIQEVRKNYDIILIDSSPNLNDEILATMIASDELLVVTSPDYPTLSTTMHAVKVAKQRKTPITGLVLNKVRNKSFELKKKEIEDATGVPIISVLNDDVKVLESLAKTKPISLHSPRNDVAIEYKKLAGLIVGEDYNDPRLWSRIKKAFAKKAKAK